MHVDLAQSVSNSFRMATERTLSYGRSPYPVLIYGETGVGKELIAKSLHLNSSRAAHPFVPVNCGALPPGLFESEFFGYERGSFSGAQSSYRGIVRSAEGGTLFLDEIGEMDLSAQVKLLRLLESNEVRSVGASRAQEVDVRIVAATHVDLNRAVQEGSFRRDLLERLSVLSIQVPALRDRPEDIPLLAEHFASRLMSDTSRADWSLLKTYDWPGNARQLRNLLIRADILGGKKVTTPLLKDLLDEERLRTAVRACNEDPNATLAEIEKKVIVDRLARNLGNRKKAARELGIAKSTLQEKLRRWKKAGAQNWPIEFHEPVAMLAR